MNIIYLTHWNRKIIGNETTKQNNPIEASCTPEVVVCAIACVMENES